MPLGVGSPLLDALDAIAVGLLDASKPTVGGLGAVVGVFAGPEIREPSQVGITLLLVNERKLLMRLARGAVTNVAFADLCNLAEGLGFELRRVSGSHHVYAHPGIPQIINLQSVRGQAKPYQVRQLLRLVERYDLRLRDRP